jgi:hypothetical protein
MNAQSPEVQPPYVQSEAQSEALVEVQPDPTQTSGTPPAAKGLRLPEPDRDNITVLLHNLPKDPVLPWNHYDSPWKSEDDRPLENEAASLESAPEPESGSELSSEIPSLEDGTILAETSAEPAPESALEPSFASEKPQTIAPEEDHKTSPTSLGEPGYVHLALPYAESLDPEAKRMEIPDATAKDTDNTIAPAPDSEPDQQLLSQLG